MKHLMRIWLFLFCVSSLQAQTESITLEKIWEGYYHPDSMEALQSLPQSDAYVVLEKDSDILQVNVYDYATQSKQFTAFSNEKYKEIQDISAIRFSQDEKKLIIETEAVPIYRHSQMAKAYVYDLQSKALIPISNQLIQEPTFNPQATKVAYVLDNDIYIFDIASKKTIRVTNDGKKNEIINGITDWVYEEEFSFVRAFEWNSTGTNLAYLKFDESEVPEFSMDIYGTDLYPRQEKIKYPKAGEKNATVALYLYDIENGKTSDLGIKSTENLEYIPRLKWSKNPHLLVVQTLNRHQNDLQLVAVDTKKATKKNILEEKDPAYVEVVDDWIFLEDNSFIWSSEQSGFKHLYHYAIDGTLINRITKGEWEVTSFYGYNPKNQKVYYQSTEPDSKRRGVYEISIDGTHKKALSKRLGTNSATFSPSFAYFINAYSSANTPPIYEMLETHRLSLKKVLIDNQTLKNRWQSNDLPTKEFFDVKIPTGEELNAYIIKPPHFDESKKYPLLMYQYSGPGSQQVYDSWLSYDDYWHFALAQKGYVVVCVDGRGTGYKGAKFKKATQFQLGKLELEDQNYVANVLKQKPYIDPNRVGIWGWSFGGFMSSNALFQHPETFKTAIAVAPVTNWRFYDSVYTERYMTTPLENPQGYDQNSPITYAGELRGNYLLVHGTADDNVHVQNSMVLINQLVHQNKSFDWLIYPDKNHGIYGGATRLQLFKKMTDFIENNL